ncbi:serine protease hepsin-like [Sardina pilchardus]|uniref:serine protease hepsin-like n=1 Tax=Sardina pilchardus TaxID=27697 RepID=UPI002E1021D2
MNICGKFLCLAAVGSLCVILYLGVIEEAAFDLEIDCGNREQKMTFPSESPVKRFVGGVPVNISDWPWVVSLQFSPSGLAPFTQLCSGSIIRKDWVLTASSCFYDPHNLRNVSNWRVVTGSSQLNDHDPYVQTSAVDDFVLNKDYHPESSSNDIALVKLTTPLIFNGTVDRVCIPDRMNVEKYKYGTCHIAGYDDYGVLKENPVAIFSNSLCNMRTWLKYKVSADMFCAGTTYGGVDGCKESVGGPLMCFVPTTGRHYVRGLRIVTKKCGVIRRPNIYLQVSKYYHWIARSVDHYYMYGNNLQH